MKRFKVLFGVINYEIFVTFLAIVSIILVTLDLSSAIVITRSPYFYIDMGILIFFWIDYLYFYIKSEDKKKYFKNNIFSLIAILPFNEILTFFRIFRILRFARFLRLTKLVRYTKFF